LLLAALRAAIQRADRHRVHPSLRPRFAVRCRRLPRPHASLPRFIEDVYKAKAIGRSDTRVPALHICANRMCDRSAWVTDVAVLDSSAPTPARLWRPTDCIRSRLIIYRVGIVKWCSGVRSFRVTYFSRLTFVTLPAEVNHPFRGVCLCSGVGRAASRLLPKRMYPFKHMRYLWHPQHPPFPRECATAADQAVRTVKLMCEQIERSRWRGS